MNAKKGTDNLDEFANVENVYRNLIIVIGRMLKRNSMEISFGNVAPSMKRI